MWNGLSCPIFFRPWHCVLLSSTKPFEVSCWLCLTRWIAIPFFLTPNHFFTLYRVILLTENCKESMIDQLNSFVRKGSDPQPSSGCVCSWTWITQRAKCQTTFSNGCLGSHNDEERSEMRYVMRIAKSSESSKLWTHLALPRKYVCWSVCSIPTKCFPWLENISESTVQGFLFFERKPPIRLDVKQNWLCCNNGKVRTKSLCVCVWGVASNRCAFSPLLLA